MDVISRAARKQAAGEHIIHMEVGQPGTAAPEAARRALREALDKEPLGYTEALGMPALRERIARHYKEFYGVDVDAEQVVITTGSSAGFLLAFLALFDVGQRVAIATPGYPCYRQIMAVLGLEAVLIETGPENRWMPTPSQVSQAIANQGASGLLIASPANPTGSMLDPGRLGELVARCAGGGAWFISDEIYHGLTYTFAAETAAGLGDNAIVINSFSKYFSMTGWRIGWMILPQQLVRTVERIQQNLFISAPAVAQVAAIGAFDGIDELERNKQVYIANRDVLLDGLSRAGFDRIVPADGAFYVYADVSRFTDDSVAYAGRMLDEIGVAVTPGVDFDQARGQRFIRLSYAGRTEDMIEGVKRIASWGAVRG
jgi:aspartate/methionine/tyrosine aminotransferase